MSSKFSLLPIFTDQLSTLVDVRTGKARIEDYVVVFGLPLLVGGVSLGQRWKLDAVSEIITGVSILTSFLFALAIYVFEVRIQLGRELNRVATSKTVQLVDEMFANTCWAIVVGLFLTGATIVCALTRGGTAAAPEPVGAVGTALLALGATHLVAVLAMALKRLHASYDQLNN